MKSLTIQDLLRNYGTREEIAAAKKLIIKNGLNSALNNVCKQIKEKLKNESMPQNNMGVIQIGGLTASILARFNEAIRSTRSNREKAELEIQLSHIALNIISYVLIEAQGSKEMLAIQIIDAIEDCCQVFEYNKMELYKFLKLDELLSAKISQVRNLEPILDPNRIAPSFKWNGTSSKEAFVSFMRKERISVDEEKWLLLLSSRTSSSLKIQLNEEIPDEVMKFFVVTDALGLLRPENTNGFYKVLQFHCSNFNKIFLKNFEPRERTRRIKARSDWEKTQSFWKRKLQALKDK